MYVYLHNTYVCSIVNDLDGWKINFNTEKENSILMLQNFSLYSIQFNLIFLILLSYFHYFSLYTYTCVHFRFSSLKLPLYKIYIFYLCIILLLFQRTFFICSFSFYSLYIFFNFFILNLFIMFTIFFE